MPKSIKRELESSHYSDVLFDNAIVGQVRKLIGAFGIVVHTCHSNVALFIDPNGQRVPVCDQYPLPYIELLILNDQWILNVFADNTCIF